MEHRKLLDLLTALFSAMSAAGLWHGVEIGSVIFSALIAGICGCIRIYDRWKYGPLK